MSGADSGDWREQLAQLWRETYDESPEFRDWQALDGGRGYRLSSVAGDCYLKFHHDAPVEYFAAEAAGLEALAASGEFVVPQPLLHGELDDRAFLLMQYLSLHGAAVDGNSDAAMVRFGRALAGLHRQRAEYHGWHRDNSIGGTPQCNSPCDDWAEFYIEYRLRPQLALLAGAAAPPRLLDAGERLCAVVPRLLGGHRPQPSLLHGDLWWGNAGWLADGRPAIIDPATYYGDRETDLALCELFGGFSTAMFAAYREAWPLAEGYPLRRELYQLYHLLNHANLFAGGYVARSLHSAERLLAEAG
mgnify:CR=1 FL=1